MLYFPVNKWSIFGIMNSKNHNYKYVVILYNNVTHKPYHLEFGNINDTQFLDNTGLNSYSHLNSNNLIERMKYIIDHKKDIKMEYYNQTYFTLKYLYNYESAP
jgi:hypothetical protein